MTQTTEKPELSKREWSLIGSCIIARLKDLRSRKGSESDFRINQLQSLLDKINDQ